MTNKETKMFAVASFYREFPDLTDQEVIHYLGKRTREIVKA
jgi:predicted phosphoribosyltransferase